MRRLQADLVPADIDLGELRKAIKANGFTAVRRVGLTGPSELERFVAQLGPLVFTPGERPLSGTTHVFEVSNINRRVQVKSVWHTDTSYVKAPPVITVLAAVKVPRSGGDTLVLDQRKAAADADAGLVEALEGVELLHVASRVRCPDETGAGTWHPALRSVGGEHSVALYLGARERIAGARRRGVALDPLETSELIDAAFSQASAAAPARHRWASGDLLFIDNRITLHAADHANVVGDRVLHRVTCGSEVPIAASSYGR